VIDTASVKHRGLEELIRTGKSKALPAALQERIRNRLAVLDSLTAIPELPPGYRAHELKGRRRGIWSIWVSGAWRMTFRFRSETVFDFDLEQYH
jgi:proteic killer suppression protein